MKLEIQLQECLRIFLKIQGENHLVEKSHFPPKNFFPPTTFCTIILNPLILVGGNGVRISYIMVLPGFCSR